jgi:hypothetical protein
MEIDVMVRSAGFVAALAIALVACGASAEDTRHDEPPAESGSVLTTPELVSMSVSRGCATLTDVATGEALITTCAPSEYNPSFAWGEDRSGTVVAMYRMPSEAFIDRIQPDGTQFVFDEASGWVKIEYSEGQPILLFTQRGDQFECPIYFSIMECQRTGE